jgi:lysozyme
LPAKNGDFPAPRRGLEAEKLCDEARGKGPPRQGLENGPPFALLTAVKERVKSMRREVAAALAVMIGVMSPSLGEEPDSRAQGIDVSDAQGRIDWAKMAASGLSFGIARVSDGLTQPDTQFATNWAGIKKAGLVRGAYQFFRPADDPVAQADLYVRTVGGFQAGDLPPFLDLEATDGVAGSEVLANVAKWVHEVEAKTLLTPLVYVSPGFWDALGRAPAPPRGVGLWVAHWGVPAPRLPVGFQQWTIWQYTQSSTLAAANGADGDIFNGTVQQLKDFAATHGPPLQSGARGAAVAALQADLALKGFSPGTDDGIFGPATLAEVKAFQEANGLAADGVVGPRTYDALVAPVDSMSAAPASASSPTRGLLGALSGN